MIDSAPTLDFIQRHKKLISVVESLLNYKSNRFTIKDPDQEKEDDGYSSGYSSGKWTN